MKQFFVLFTSFTFLLSFAQEDKKKQQEKIIEQYLTNCAQKYSYVSQMSKWQNCLDEGLKIAVALSFEIFARGETSQIDDATGNITEVAPPTAATAQSSKSNADPYKIVKEILRPYKLAFENATNVSDRGVKFL